MKNQNLELEARLEGIATLARAEALKLTIIEAHDLNRRDLNTLLEGHRALFGIMAESAGAD